jgi:hypothetical protein
MPPLSIFTPAAPSQPDNSAKNPSFCAPIGVHPRTTNFDGYAKFQVHPSTGREAANQSFLLGNLPPNVVPPSNLICIARRTSWNLKFDGCPGIIESTRYANFHVITMRNKGMLSISNLVDSIQLQ